MECIFLVSPMSPTLMPLTRHIMPLRHDMYIKVWHERVGAWWTDLLPFLKVSRLYKCNSI
jgi:hypothetical protein